MEDGWPLDPGVGGSRGAANPGCSRLSGGFFLTSSPRRHHLREEIGLFAFTALPKLEQIGHEHTKRKIAEWKGG